jgi:outer membrane cobalamin receptor
MRIRDIEQVSVTTNRTSLFKEDKFILRFDSLAQQLYKNQNIGELLQNNSSVVIHQYGGMGSTSNISFRGTGATHTQVSWNGFSINSLTLGQADLSTIFSSVSDQIQLINGTSGALYGSGTFGGVIELNTQPNWQNIFYVDINTEIGAYTKKIDNNQFSIKPGQLDNKTFSLKLKLGSNKVQFHTTLVNQDALNQYPYISQSFRKPIVVMTHNNYYSQAFISSLSVKLTNNQTLEGGFWTQRKYYEIPLSNALQGDTSLRTYLKWGWVENNWGVFAKSGFFYDFMHYSNMTTNSIIKGYRLINDLNFRYYFSKVILNVGVSSTEMTAKTNQYLKSSNTDRTYSSYIDSKINTKYAGLNISFRQDFSKSYETKPQASIGLFRKIYIFNLRGNISNKFRLPTFNERYWPDLGDINIQPENGWGIDGGFDAELNFENIKSILNVTVYTMKIQNLIQWKPPGYNVSNVGEVWSRGIEGQLDQGIYFWITILNWNLKYNLTPATTTKSNDSAVIGKQLMLVPLHSVNAMLSVKMKNFSTGVTFILKSSTYNTNDQSGLPLNGYSLYNFYISKSFQYKSNNLRIDFKINNIRNEQFRTIPDYPMPGRAYFISINYIFNKSNLN